MGSREDRVIGAVLGSAVGDAVGAPFEFGPPLAFSQRFPRTTGDDAAMSGGGGWETGEATDDTQMALLVAESLLDCGGFDGADMYRRFQQWAAGAPKDIGLQTAAVLGSAMPWDTAAAQYFADTQRAAGNGSLMRTTPAAVRYAAGGRTVTMDAARRISAVTHGDAAAGEGCAIYHELIRMALDGLDPLRTIDDVLDDVLDEVAVEHRHRWAAVLTPDWHPEQATESNGAVWPTLGSAVWALRTTSSFTDAIRLAVDLGGDTDTVAAVTGGLAGAVHGIHVIPNSWTAALFVTLPGFGDRVWTAADLSDLAIRLDAAGRLNV